MMARFWCRDPETWDGPASDEQYNMDNTTRTYTVISFADNNPIFQNGSAVSRLDRGQTTTLLLGPGGGWHSGKAATGFIQSASSRAQQTVSRRFQGTTIPFSIQRNSNNTSVTVKSFGNSNVTLVDETNNNVLTTLSMVDGQFAEIASSLPRQSRAYGVFSDNAPILVGTYDDNQDWCPATRIIPGAAAYGFRSNQVDLSGFRTNSTNTPYVLTRDDTTTAFNQDLTFGASGSDPYYSENPANFTAGQLLSGPALKVQPSSGSDFLAIRQTADSNGTEATPWFHEVDFADTFYVAGIGATAYVSAIATQPGTATIRRVDNDVVLATGNFVGNATAGVYHFYATSFSTGNNIPDTPWYMTTTVPCAAWADLNGQDETYLPGATRIR